MGGRDEPGDGVREDARVAPETPEPATTGQATDADGADTAEDRAEVAAETPDAGEPTSTPAGTGAGKGRETAPATGGRPDPRVPTTATTTPSRAAKTPARPHRDTTDEPTDEPTDPAPEAAAERSDPRTTPPRRPTPADGAPAGAETSSDTTPSRRPTPADRASAGSAAAVSPAGGEAVAGGSDRTGVDTTPPRRQAEDGRARDGGAATASADGAEAAAGRAGAGSDRSGSGRGGSGAGSSGREGGRVIGGSGGVGSAVGAGGALVRGSAGDGGERGERLSRFVPLRDPDAEPRPLPAHRPRTAPEATAPPTVSVPAKARPTAETDAERTSKLRVLKDLTPEAGADARSETTAPPTVAVPPRPAAETDAERTSKLVVLKEADLPRRDEDTALLPLPSVPRTASDDEGASTPKSAHSAPAARPAGPRPGAPQAPSADRLAPRAPIPAPGGGAPAVASAPVPGKPQPPLDLLAELTNTAPPPETPRRTAVRRVKVWTPITLLLLGGVAAAQLLRPLPAAAFEAVRDSHTVPGATSLPWPASGQGAVRVVGSGDVAVFGEQKVVPTASVAKVMTAYVILKEHPLRKGQDGPKITVDAKAVADGTSEHESRIEGLTVGATFSQLDMLRMLMIPSGNNVARLLARWDTGSDSEAAFVAKMNAAAKDLGMTNTTYTDPSGLDAKTVSTSVDQLKLAEAVMRDEVFRSVVAMPNATIPGLPTPINNNNDDLLLAGLSIKGIKTGSSSAAGGTLLWATYKTVGDKTPLVVGTMMDQHAPGPDVNGGDSLKLVKQNSRKVIEAVRAALASTPVVRKGDKVGELSDGLGGRVPLVATKDLNVLGVPGQKLRFSLDGLADGGAVPEEAAAGTVVGRVTIGDGEGTGSVPVALGEHRPEPSLWSRLSRLS
ncbi:serine hydrolase (plasmid) [Streptomyces sp. BI20]|uniref:D-alanyl-D-alanine carboxypeptidase family protein n=1 Tax=Streptomyces sp. BI20 TaxID=3403460 RepID=UPI003C7830FA